MPDRAAQRSAVERALLEFHRTPGKYALIRRQPSVLFSSVKDVLQIASGRAPETDSASAPASPVRQAACFFVRSALLYPDADHYALLGLDKDADAAEIKDRYRQMMRLMHPDFAGALNDADWPADAATRVNQAYDVLSSPVRRRAFDEARDPPAPPSPQPRPDARAAFRAAAHPPKTHPRYRLKQLAAVFGVAGSVALAATLYVGSANEKESLVQRSREIDEMVAAALPAQEPSPAPEAIAMPQVPAADNAEPGEIAASPPLPAIRIEAAPAPALPIAASPAPVPRTLPPASAVATTAVPRLEAQPLAPASAAIAKQPELPPVATIAPARVAPAPLAVIVAAVPAPAPAPMPVAAALAVPAPLPSPVPLVAATPAASPAFAPIPSPAPAPVVVAAARPAVFSPAAGPAPAPVRAGTSVTLADVHPLLSKLLQQMESGWGDQVLSVLEREARAAPAAQALARNYTALLDGSHRVRLANVQFKSEPREGRLLVIGHVSMLVGEAGPGVAPKQLSVQAEFASRDGSVVMTRLAQVDN